MAILCIQRLCFLPFVAACQSVISKSHIANRPGHRRSDTLGTGTRFRSTPILFEAEAILKNTAVSPLALRWCTTGWRLLSASVESHLPAVEISPGHSPRRKLMIIFKSYSCWWVQSTWNVVPIIHRSVLFFESQATKQPHSHASFCSYYTKSYIWSRFHPIMPSYIAQKTYRALTHHEQESDNSNVIVCETVYYNSRLQNCTTQNGP